MRIIAGTWKGHPLRSPPGDETRPTTDRVREALFSILGPPPDNARVLDLFAGSGALGLEALSRGACSAVFVDAAKRAVKTIHENIKTLAAEQQCEVHLAPAARAMTKTAPPFHWIFVDPPYGRGLYLETLSSVAKLGLLSDDGTLVCEHDKRTRLPDAVAGLQRGAERTYGDTTLSLYRRSTKTGL